MIDVVIRQPEVLEISAVGALVQTVVKEIYGNIWAPPPLPIDQENWTLAWIAIVDTTIVGMVLTNDEWISDLWVLRAFRGCGIGRKLLTRGEAEIAGRGCRKFRLRVVKFNSAAIRFYLRHGWRVAREFRHETLPITMFEMMKSNDEVPNDADLE